MVIRVDKDKGYIDLSKRRVSKEDIERCTEKYSKAKAVNSIVRHVAEILGFKNNDELEELYKKTAWYFESKSKKHGTAFTSRSELGEFYVLKEIVLHIF